MATLSLIKQPFDFTFSRNPILFRFRVTPYEQLDTDLNTRVNVALEVESEHMRFDMTERKLVSLRPDAKGFCEVDFQTVLNAQLEFYVPQPKSLTAQVCKKQSLYYRIKYYLSNDYETVVDIQYTSFAIVVKGGLSIEQADIKTFFETQTTYGGVKKTFLRFESQEELYHREEPLWMYLLVPFRTQAITSVTLNIVTEDNDGNVQNHNKTTQLRSNTGGIICLPCGIGPVQHNLANYKDVVNLYCRVYDQDNILLAQNTWQFVVDNRNYYRTRSLYYHNSIGGFERIRLTGVVENKGSYTKETAIGIQSKEYDQTGVIASDESQYSSREKRIATGQTGFLPLEHIDLLRDLLNSNKAFEFITKDNTLSFNKLVPVQIKAQEAEFPDNDEQLHSLEITWDNAYTDENYTPPNLVPVLEVCPSVVFFNVSQIFGGKLFVEWQLPQSYDCIEIWITQDAIPNPPPTQGLSVYSYLFDKNSGSAHIELDNGYFDAGTIPPYTKDIRIWARVICDKSVINHNSLSAGPWTTTKIFAAYKYAAPILRTCIANTFKGATPRPLSFKDGNSVFNNATLVNSPSFFLATTTTVTGDKGGTIGISASLGDVTYTPVNGSFIGTEIFEYTALEEIIDPPNVYQSKSASAKVYVNVEDLLGSVSGTGKPYLKVLITNYEYQTENMDGGPVYRTMADIYVQFFVDPQGTQPVNLSGSGISITLQTFNVNNGGTPTLNGTKTSVAIGTQVLFYQRVLVRYEAPGRPVYLSEVYRQIVPSSDFFII